ncbi:MAG TPA: hypothetical protein VFW47_00255 [Phenylobacterium sp.]|nr:hypothetical protein [Phenylobacterium sp.]
MHQTYELYFHDEDGSVRFEPLTCPPEAQLIGLVRSRLAAEGAASVEVHQFGSMLFTLNR